MKLLMSPHFRYRCGVPASLNRFQLLGSHCMVRLEPWPDLNVNSICNNDGILNAIDLMLDSDGILWLLDIGEENTLGPPPYKFNTLKCSQNCTVRVEEPPRVLGIHIGNCSLEYRFELSGLIADQSRLQYITVEKTRSNQKIIYVTDAGTRSLIMFEADAGRGFRILLPACLEEGESNKDILYMTLVARQDCVKPSSLLFLTYLTSRRMFVLPTDKLWKKKTTGEIMLVGPKPGPMVILGSDGEKRIFFRMRGDCDIFVWNIEDEFSTSNFHLVRASTCRRATHVAPGYLGMIWVLESNFHDYVRGTTGCAGPSTKLLPIMNKSDENPEIVKNSGVCRKKKTCWTHYPKNSAYMTSVLNLVLEDRLSEFINWTFN